MPREKWSIKKLEACLQELEGFNKPKVKLEQYATPPHIAAIILHTIDTSFNDLRGKLVADLGCGTGSLTIGSILHDTKMVYGFDIDNNALCTMLDNIQGALSDEGDGDDRSYAFKSCRNFDLIQVDVVSQNCASFWKPWSKFFDTVIMNPPFGTKQNSGLDMLFLKRAIDISCGSVYSLHKTSTRSVSIESLQYC